jgi:hypothetical protein
MTDLADNAAALAEGYVRIQEDRGASAPGGQRFVSRYEKSFDGDLQSGGLRRVEGNDTTSQANADAKALAALNGFRRHIFGTGATVNTGPRSGQTLVLTKN